MNLSEIVRRFVNSRSCAARRVPSLECWRKVAVFLGRGDVHDFECLAQWSKDALTEHLPEAEAVVNSMKQLEEVLEHH